MHSDVSLTATVRSMQKDDRTRLSAVVPDYPQPVVPVLPIVSWNICLGARRPGVRSVLDTRQRLNVTGGTEAIALALEHAGIKAGDKVLLPAFHCRSMIEPFLAVGARTVYYRIAEDLAVDVDDIRSKLDSRTRALLVTHYFGFYQDMRTLRSLCDRYQSALIEDCAHAFFGTINGQPVGSYGDYAVASARKFFPIQDGGYLISAHSPLSGLTIRSGGCAFNIKAALDTLETATAYGRLMPLSFVLNPLLGLKSYLWNKIKAGRNASMATSIESGRSEDYQYLDVDSIHTRMSFVSRCLMRLSAKGNIVGRRRAHYQKLAVGLSGLPNARPLFANLPDDVVPYMFPLVVDAPDTVFPILKRSGVPLWRWEDIEPTECEISRKYSRRLFQLPCHQALREREIDWIIANVKQGLSVSQ